MKAGGSKPRVKHPTGRADAAFRSNKYCQLLKELCYILNPATFGLHRPVVEHLEYGF